MKTQEQMIQAFDEIQMPRTPYVLDRMVVGSKFTEEQRYAQCVLELSIAYDNLRTAECHFRLKEIEIGEMTGKDEKTELNRKIKQIEQEQTRRAALGAKREFDYLYALWQSFPKDFTREDLNNAQPEEFRMRLETQAQQDMLASGRIGAGNQEGLRQRGKVVYPQLDVARDVERRFLENGKFRILVCVPTEHKDEKLECLNGLEFPAGAEVKILNTFGRPVAENYNDAVQQALNDKADFLVTIEDDTFPQKDALVKLFDLIRKYPKSAIGAWYPKKEEARQGVHIIVKDGQRTDMKDDGTIQEALTLAMGCSVYPIEMFMTTQFPWFVTTQQLSQDSYFSQLARDTGWKLLVDTSIKCGHKDRATGKMYK